MTQRKYLVAALLVTLTAALLVACGGSAAAPTPTPPPPSPTATTPPSPTPDLSLDPRCIATEAYALEYLVAVIGDHGVPTAFDAINTGGCSFSFPITQLTVELSGEGRGQTATIPLPMPVNDIALPLPLAIEVPPLDATLPAGFYERTVTASTGLRGQEAVLPGFEPVLLVRDPDSTTAQLLRAQSRWARNGFPNYTYRAAWTCFCLREYVALVDVNVVDGRVTNVSFAEPGFTGEVPSPERFGPVGELFQFVQDAIERGSARIDAKFHPELGYPVKVFVDFDERLANEEMGFTVRSLSAT